MFAGRRLGGCCAAVGRLGRRRLWGAVLAAVLLAAGCGGAGQEGEAGRPPDAGQPPSDGERPRATARLYPGVGRLDAPGGVFADVAVGGFSSCGVRDTGEVVCWGNGKTVDWAPMGGEFTAVEVWRGRGGYFPEDHACGLRVDGVVVCWGLEIDDVGEAAVVERYDSGEARRWELRSEDRPAGSEGFVDLVAGAGGVCGIGAGGSAACWDGRGWVEAAGAPGGARVLWVGDDQVCAQLAGGGRAGCWARLASVTGAGALKGVEGPFADVSAQYGAGCGLRQDDTAVCWGQDGPWDPRDYNRAYEMVPLPADKEFSQISVIGNRFGAFFSGCGVEAGGGQGGPVFCWGANDDGQAGAPDGEFAQVVTMDGSACGLRADGTVVCWPGDSPVGAVHRADLGPFSQIAASPRMKCALRADGAPVCNVNPPTSAALGGLAQVSVSGSRACGLRQDATALCWFPRSDWDTVEVPGGGYTQIWASAAVAYGMDVVCGLRQDATARCWRRGKGWAEVAAPFGELAAFDARGPCGVVADTAAIACWKPFGLSAAPPTGTGPLAEIDAGGGRRFCGITADDGAVVCWHPGEQEAIDLGEGFASGFVDVSVGSVGAGCAIGSDGSLACWGRFADVDEDFWGEPGAVGSGWRPLDRGVDGELFDGSGDAVEPPGGRFESVSVGARHACAVRVGGELVCWGHEHDWPYDWDSDRICDRRVDICPG